MKRKMIAYSFLDDLLFGQPFKVRLTLEESASLVTFLESEAFEKCRKTKGMARLATKLIEADKEAFR